MKEHGIRQLRQRLARAIPRRISHCFDAAALLGLIVLAGCSTTGNTFHTSGIGQLVIGRTTLAQASEDLGAQPTDTWQQGDTLLARWGYRNTAATDAVYLRQVLWLRFGPDGTLMRMERGVNLPLNAHPQAVRPAGPPAATGLMVPQDPGTGPSGFSSPGAAPSGLSVPGPSSPAASGADLAEQPGDLIYIPGPGQARPASAADTMPEENPLLTPGAQLAPGPVYPVR